MCNKINYVSNHLKNYHLEVWNLINKFLEFDIISIPRSLNVNTDLLVNVTSRLVPS